jgi:putative DNA primase/helicase
MDPRWRLTYNEMRLTPELGGLPLTDPMLGRIREELLEGRWGLYKGSGQDAVRNAICTVAAERSHHPVRTYLRDLVWDGEARMDRVLADILGVREPSAIQRTMMRKWFVQAVARIMEPGCKADSVLVLAGEQYAGKSAFFRLLVPTPDLFADSRMDIRNKDGTLQLYAAWIYEWPEIDQVTLERSASEIKGYLSQQQDTLRKPYAQGVSVEKRHTVIVGTTNRTEYLNDPTGSRRFWTIAIPVGWDIDQGRLIAWRDQLWAEAMHAYTYGETWHLSREEEAARAADAAQHTAGDPWEEPIRQWVVRERKTLVTVHEVLEDALGLRAGERDKARDMRVADILRGLGWAHVRAYGTDGIQRRMWKKPGS